MFIFKSYAGAVALLLVVIFIVALSGDTAVPQAPAITTRNASSTLAVADTRVATSTQAPAVIAPKKVTPTTLKPALKPAPVVTAPPKEASPPSATTTLVALPTSGSASFDASAAALRSALVNIVCYVPAGSRLHSISGSGVIVDPKGIILTNAHIAQYFLIMNRNISCGIRAGSPATNTYMASLIYISPAWIRANASVLTQFSPSGTGEYDFALLAVAKSATSAPLPLSFPYIQLATTPPDTGTPVVIASYGAQFLESSQIQSSLFPTVVFGSVKDVFTFTTTTIDVLALGGSAAAQEGSSGGGVANSSGELVGTITTSTTKGVTDTRSLSAITASYIRSEYAGETGQALDLLLAEATSTSISNFAPQMPALEAILTAQLQ